MGLHITISIVLCGISASIIIWLWRRKKTPPLIYTNEYPKSNFSHETATLDVSFNEKSKLYQDQSSEWREAFAAIGRTLQKNEVEAQFFVHGTFVGNDPLQLIESLSRLSGEKMTTLLESIKKIYKKQANSIIKDSGNYLPEYVEIAEKASSIPAFEVVWSSGNDHVSRLRASINLLQNIESKISAGILHPNARILVNCHSHGGQLLALCSHILGKSDMGKQLIKFSHSQLGLEFKQTIHRVRNIKWDIATFGSPIRYPWFLKTGKMRLLNIVNHRGHTYLGSATAGILTTRDGDYVQQWGIQGSDVPTPSRQDRKLNRALESILGPGAQPQIWYNHLNQKMRVSPFATTMLVDYQDSNDLLPNCFTTLFGHGCYTRFRFLLYNSTIVANYFYNHQRPHIETLH